MKLSGTNISPRFSLAPKNLESGTDLSKLRTSLSRAGMGAGIEKRMSMRFPPTMGGNEQDDVNHENLTTAAEALTPDQIHAFKEAFDLFDNNGGGTIDAIELKSTLDSVRIEIEAE